MVCYKKIVEGGAEDVETSFTGFNIRMEINSVKINKSSNKVDISVKRKAGRVNFEGIKFVISNKTNSESFDSAVVLKELENKNFNFTLVNINASTLKTISLYAKIGGKYGDAVDVFTITEGSDVFNYGDGPGQTNCNDDDEDNYCLESESSGCKEIGICELGWDDCNDENAGIHPGATEVCNWVDDNCVNGIDEGSLCGGTDQCISGSCVPLTNLCESCASCNSVINGASLGEVIVLSGDISTSGNCIALINKEDLTLDCNGHNITGNGVFVGIALYGKDHNILQNCYINNFSTGIQIAGSNYNQIKNIGLYSNGVTGLEFTQAPPSYWFSYYNSLTNITSIGNGNSIGVQLYGTSNNNLNNIITKNHSIGIKILQNSPNNLLQNIITNGNSVGINIESGNNVIEFLNSSFNSNIGIHFYYWPAKNNTLRNSIINNPSSIGIEFRNSSLFIQQNNFIYNNFFNNFLNVNFNTVAPLNFWNNSVGGNYWTNPSGTRCPTPCNDIDPDGICDNSCALDASNIDYSPLVNPPSF